MSDRTALGDRMKAYERATRSVLPRRAYTILRVDGRAFHTFLRDARRPFDPAVMDAMNEVGRALCEEITGSVFAYVQSDECSVLATPDGKGGDRPRRAVVVGGAGGAPLHRGPRRMARRRHPRHAVADRGKDLMTAGRRS
ncbi:tRNA(His) guanylyltransferase Thg1 family protein [Microbispora hainanensis]|jgi:hypothetical protein|uniref:tRNA(His) guanylyltransferase Thg1 family protein n=1 Tax=Microbispora TaxID=2005 RepID=UPI001158BC33|nr:MULTISPECIES: tRNA(His) guanylyltransferase Thg1 family protein [Microbispora]NJP27251.1 hypothetical protein [Microbispora sp. CL1-1]TQS11305.1 hypothetical protein FLW53_24220 [Microbispora sp. SCL1-1]